MKTTAQENDTHRIFENMLAKGEGGATIQPEDYQAYAEYMSAIILQLPNANRLKLLTGTSSGQASFYFMNEKKEINATLYNNLLNQRVVGEGTHYGVDQVGLTNDSFTNSYLSVYTKIRYQLSPDDKKAQQKINDDVASTVRTLIPVWNTLVIKAKPLGIRILNDRNTDIALIQLTDTLNTIWLNLAYKETLKNDPSYPYIHLNDFRNIYSKIPDSAPEEMVTLLIEVYNLSGAAGAITSNIANATHTISGIISNIQQPTSENKGSSLTKSSKTVPGLSFDPIDPNSIIHQLNQYPILSYTNTHEVTKLSNDTLTITTLTAREIEISPINFLSCTALDGYRSSIFKEAFAGSSYHVKAIINNPVVNPQINCNPLPFNISTNQGWMLTDPIKDAISNGYPAPSDITGYVFNSKPNFNFNKGGNFGYINAMVFSQFLELYITFNSCISKKVKEYFRQNKSSKFNFVGHQFISCEYHFLEETENSIIVVIKPTPPGYLPPETDNIEYSSCQLVAVEVLYPFA